MLRNCTQKLGTNEATYVVYTMARRYLALQNDPDLAPFIMEGRPTSRQLGGGSYGSVEEIELVGCSDICAGKRIHEILLEAENEGRGNMVEQFRQECRLMSSLRHPNITQFLGLCFLPSPVLLMEKLQGSLDELLENIHDIPLSVKRSFLEDVARGLRFLHTHNPQIIHRDLTAKNVLLTLSLQCKITDFGNSRIVNLQPGQLAQTLSRVPGTILYMPPEAFEHPSDYGPSLDIFSFGHLALFTLMQVFPDILLAPTYHNENNLLVGRTEVERRERYFTLLEGRGLGNQHPLVEMMRQCLHNQPSERPRVDQLVTVLEGMCTNIGGPFGNAARINVMQQIASMRAIRERETEIREKNEMIDQLQQQIEQQQINYNAELAQKNNEIQQRDIQLEESQEQNAQLQNEVATLGESQQQKDELIQEKEETIREKEELIQDLDETIQNRDELIQEKDEIIEEKETELDQVQDQLRGLRRELQQAIRMKDREISAVQEELRRKEREHKQAIRMKDRDISAVQEKLRRKEAKIQNRDYVISEVKERYGIKIVKVRGRFRVDDDYYL